MLARIAPGPAGFDIRTFECPACDHVHQRVVELVDPMKSFETTGWLRGEFASANVSLLTMAHAPRSSPTLARTPPRRTGEGAGLFPALSGLV
jgi:hypothetical protein